MYILRENCILNIDILIAYLIKLKKREEKISLVAHSKTEA